MAANNDHERDPVQLVLSNAVAFRHILTYLPFSDLKSCSEVNKCWNFEVRSFIRDCRLCNATISEEFPCADLEKLNAALAGMNVIPINSLTIREIGTFSYCECVSGAYNEEKYTHLLKKLPLKHLLGPADMFFPPEAVTCPGTTLVMKLLEEYAAELDSLTFDSTPYASQRSETWSPWLPKLKVLDFGSVDEWRSQKELLVKLIQGAPNLNKLRGSIDSSRMLEELPEDTFGLLGDLRLNMTTPVVEELCLKVAQARPALSRLWFNAPSRAAGGLHQFHPRSFYNVLEKLLASSKNTLEELFMTFNIFPLSRLNFSPLVNLRSLSITTESTNQKLLDVIKSIDYPRMFPSLQEVNLHASAEANGEDEFEDVEEVLFGDLAHVNSYSSKSVHKLKIKINLDKIGLSDLQPVFPALSSLDVIPEFRDFAPIPYKCIWKYWPELESLQVTEGRAALNQNFDADFLGIHPEEVEYLMGQDDEFLTNFHLVPTCPSILTMRNLRNLTIIFDSDDFGSDVEQDQTFFSRVTGFLALDRGRTPRLQACITSTMAETFMGLEHLAPFVWMYSEDF